MDYQLISKNYEASALKRYLTQGSLASLHIMRNASNKYEVEIRYRNKVAGELRPIQGTLRTITVCAYHGFRHTLVGQWIWREKHLVGDLALALTSCMTFDKSFHLCLFFQ